MKEILVTFPVKEKHKKLLESSGRNLHFTYTTAAEASKKEVIETADIILGNVSADALKEAKKLKFLQLNSAGANEYVIPGVLPDGVKLCNATGAYGKSIAEHMLAAAFTLLKKMNHYEDNRLQHLWKDEGNVGTIFGSTTLILGMGDIGSEFAMRMHALGSHVIAVRRNKSEKPDYIDALYQMDALEELLPQADIVACSLPGTDATYHLLNTSRLKLMKNSAILINVGRGTLIPTEDLIDALKNGTIAAAAIDVAEAEPLPADSPLWDVPNLLITPHVAGNFHTRHIWDTIVEIAAENLKAYLNEQPLRNEVDFETGYRKYFK
ncbi:MAG: D-2-hydroxyacid dehydrogenase [Marvinbryantia sp.]|jgi:phosphoglycerate dehydrogenase-like enzyme